MDDRELKKKKGFLTEPISRVLYNNIAKKKKTMKFPHPPTCSAL